MAERVVRVSLQAQVSNYLAGMEQARKSTEKVGTEAEQAKRKLEAQSQAMTSIGTGMLAVGAIAAVGIGLAVKKFADFDAAMSNVKAATQESTENMGLLRDAALAAGASTVFSATEAAGAIEELGKNGLTTTQILNGGLSGALALASAGQLGVARAAEVAAVSMKQFGLEGKAIPHIADLLAAGAGKAAGDVEDMAQALGQAGLVANQTGLTIEETTGLLSAFADAGLKGSDGGTALKAALQRLTPQSKEAKAEMERLGIAAYDSAGQFVGASQFAGVLEDGLKGLTDEQRNASMGIIFGSDAVRAASIMYDQGADGIKKYIDQTNDSGYAAKVAADRLDNLKGDVEQLGGAFDTYLIKSGSGANDMLRTLVAGATGLVTAVGALPEPVLGAGLALGGLVTAVALAGGAFLVAVPKIASAKASLSTLGISAGSAARGVGLLSGGLAVAGIAFSVFAARQATATANTQEFKDSLDPATGAITNYTRELVAKKLAESGAYGNAMTAAGISQRDLTDAVLAGGSALDKVKKKLSAENTIFSFFDGTGIAAGNASGAINDLAGDLDRSGTEFDDQAKAAEGSAESTDGAAGAYQSAADKASELQSNLTALIDTINAANGVGQDAISQNIAYQSALADVDAQIAAIAAGTEGYALGLDASTEAGRSNLGMLNELAGSSQSAANAQFDLDGNTAAYRDTLEAGRQAVIDRAIALGATADEAQALADKIYAIPSERQFKMIADTAAATEKLAQFLRDLNNIPGQRDVIINQVVKETGAPRGQVGAAYNEDGGLYAYENGGIREGIYAGRPGGILKFAEENVPWEAFISGKPGQERRNIGIWEEAGHRLGVPGYANGGFTGYAPQIQYASSAPGWGGGGSSAPAQTIQHIQITAPAIETQDALTYATVMGREFGRQVAG